MRRRSVLAIAVVALLACAAVIHAQFGPAYPNGSNSAGGANPTVLFTTPTPLPGQVLTGAPGAITGITIGGDSQMSVAGNTGTVTNIGLNGYPVTNSTPVTGCQFQGTGSGYACETPTATPTPSPTPTAAPSPALAPNAVNNRGTCASGGNVSCDLSLGSVCAFTVNNSGGCTINKPTNGVLNQLYWLYVTQGTGQNGETWASGWKEMSTTSGSAQSPPSTFAPAPSTTIHIPFTYDGTNYWVGNFAPDLMGVQLFVGTGGTQNFKVNGSGVVVGTDTAMTNAPRMSLSFYIGPITAITANEEFGLFKTVKPITIDNAELVIGAQTCTVDTVIKLWDCGATVNSCGSPTTLATCTAVHTDSAGHQYDCTVNSASVAAAHYLTWETDSGTCTAATFSGSAAYNMQ